MKVIYLKITFLWKFLKNRFWHPICVSVNAFKLLTNLKQNSTLFKCKVWGKYDTPCTFRGTCCFLLKLSIDIFQIWFLSITIKRNIRTEKGNSDWYCKNAKKKWIRKCYLSSCFTIVALYRMKFHELISNCSSSYYKSFNVFTI